MKIEHNRTENHIATPTSAGLQNSKTQKARPHIVAVRAARQARRANH